ncbi:hypothetical protein [Sphaerospermopsis torques-reginae]|jgi:hypothetical protein|uniref:Uncharacterized protein n=1 Tax=Sphaerospermopsis torques-reginae ITEP-024 TaxID=984208 RepID=A0ABX8X3V9_9CYAN|nr:hypothetical protein [Sphaerospermopsis torques-reginae]QYX33399.1 hypothetical protein K2F26_08805 [Sphaerospermopsis torques-reginae ITEP-024]
MKPINPLTSACRYCRHYQPEGRRGGMCQQLNAPVQAGWKACSLAIPAFAPTWESLEDGWSLPLSKPIVPILPVTANINSDLENLEFTTVAETSVSSLPEVKTKVLAV